MFVNHDPLNEEHLNSWIVLFDLLSEKDSFGDNKIQLNNWISI